MNQQIEVTEEGGIRLAVPVQPFVADPGCSKCANNKPSWLLNLMVQLRGQSTFSSVSYRFCKGSLPPSEKLVGLQAALMGETETENTCAGVEHGHLHVTCGRCKHTWLMHTADRA